MPTVAVIGAGIAGMTTAHELVCRGYNVTVFEARDRDAVGGKCRSQYFDVDGIGRLPGEHGFRFFPGFYRHAPEMLARIPRNTATADPSLALEPYQDSVASRFRPCDGMGIARPSRDLAVIKLDKIDTPREVLAAIEFLWTVLLPVNKADVLYLSRRFLRYLCTCDERRLAEFDKQSLWDHVNGDNLHPETQVVLQNVPRSLVAMDAKQGNTRTFFNTLWMMTSEWMVDQESHRVLAGPSSDVWLWPWRDWLERLGVEFRWNTTVTRLEVGESGAVVGLHAKKTGPRTRKTSLFEADHVVIAVPIDVAQGLVTEPMKAACSHCQAVTSAVFEEITGAMAGAQFYLREDAPLMRGHIGYIYAEWGLTSVSQAQFWDDEHLAAFDGVGGVLSVCVTDLDKADSVSGKTARESSPEEWRGAILRQLRVCFEEHPDHERLNDDNIVAWHLDDDLTFGPNGLLHNSSGLLIHPPGQWDCRPEAVSGINGLYFAGDYVRNPADLATMEGATASGRMVVNGILDADASTAPRAAVYNLLSLHETDLIAGRKDLDRVLFGEYMPPVALGDALHPFLDDKDDPHDWSLTPIREALGAFDVMLGKALADFGLAKKLVESAREQAGQGPPGGAEEHPAGKGRGFFGAWAKGKTRAFAIPVEIPMVRADQDAWTHLIGRYGGELAPPGRSIGLIRDLSVLKSDSLDPGRLATMVRDFYHVTSQFEMAATVRWASPIVGRAWSAVAGLLGQLDPGPVDRITASQFSTDLARLDNFPNADLGARLWRRRFGATRRPFYTSIARPYIGPSRDGFKQVSYLHIAVPYFFGTLAIVMELTNTEGGGLAMSSRRSGAMGADTGMWVIPTGQPWAAFRAPLADGESLIVEPSESILRGRHTAQAAGRRVLSLGYQISPVRDVS